MTLKYFKTSLQRLLCEQGQLRIDTVDLSRLAQIKTDEREQKARDFLKAELKRVQILSNSSFVDSYYQILSNMPIILYNYPLKIFKLTSRIILIEWKNKINKTNKINNRSNLQWFCCYNFHIIIMFFLDIFFLFSVPTVYLSLVETFETRSILYCSNKSTNHTAKSPWIEINHAW